MLPWERRLKDLAQLLKNCETTYFDPELYRMNTNQFLQTARTVTFIIQKNKATIPCYETWYAENVIKPWANDPLMTWAKNSRNQIEKEGDLDLYSSLGVSLIYSYTKLGIASCAHLCVRKALRLQCCLSAPCGDCVG